MREFLRAVVREAAQMPLPPSQATANLAVQAMISEGIPYITLETYHILRRPQAYHIANTVLQDLHVLQRGKYLLRWRRRLMDYTFSREDALILSYASFGVDLLASRLGVDVVVTTDIVMKERWEIEFDQIKKRFNRMTCQLKTPYRSATLPPVLTPSEVLVSLIG